MSLIYIVDVCMCSIIVFLDILKAHRKNKTKNLIGALKRILINISVNVSDWILSILVAAVTDKLATLFSFSGFVLPREKKELY